MSVQPKYKSLLKEDFGVRSVQSESQVFVGCSSWEGSTESHAQQSSVSKSLSLNMGVPTQHFHNTKQLIFQFQDQDSSSTQSTGQSHSEVASMKGNLYGNDMISTLSGYNETQGKTMGSHIKQVSSMGNQDFVFPSQLDYVQPIAHIPFGYGEPYFGGLLAAAAYGPHAVGHNSQAVGMAPARMPLPLDLTEDEPPIYVNAKQYRAILRRRKFRAKLEAQNKFLKVRKPYLHESRHLHALKRARGSGGRFLNSKDVQESNHAPSGHGLHASSSARSHLNNKMKESVVQQLENYKDGSSTTSCSEVTSASNSDDVFQQQDFRFSGYPMHGHDVDSCRGVNQHHISTRR
ncbi:nuclear transcription factor Y subunit A-3-like isoform X1 [Humulus lupulus]|uniref:nuclear transcription factor Y subunit A-3-like isoform X1 n=1 Tax=Humulus lupulus TaxID=3486 RepID=UPI002B40F218|nr:nuclear transcription factor Y subunit A-3-like isoform X1 [Humulus lupulus]XP_062087760.1 nuclear transcription factor Y subunit A-3-like isoform X1 [Humulus lupulus]